MEVFLGGFDGREFLLDLFRIELVELFGQVDAEYLPNVEHQVPELVEVLFFGFDRLAGAPEQI